MYSWLTLNIKQQMEIQVDQFLTAKGVETYLPLVQKYIARRRRKELAPFFPGYLFARIDLTSSDYLELNWTPGLKNIVKFGGNVARVPDLVIDEIRQRLPQLEKAGYFDKAKKFHSGDLVRIKAGPLKDWDAIFDRNLSKEGRVRVFLETLGRLTACEVDSSWIEKVS